MPDYSKTVIYKIVCKDVNINYLYVGSTTNLKKRKEYHKSDCYNINSKAYNQKKYVQMREHGGFENFEIIEIEKYPCNNNREAEEREEEVRLELKAGINFKRCYLSEEEKKEYQKDWYKANKTQINEQQKVYRELNIQKSKDYQKDYRDLNKIKAKEKFKCVCGGQYTYCSKSIHEKTKKHQNYINNL